MHSHHFLPSALLLSSVAAFTPLVRRQSEKSWTPPRETARPGDSNRLGWSPKPTDLPGSVPQYGGMELLRRADDFSLGKNTCGFVSASTPAPVTCVEPGSYCTDDGVGNMDCCSGDYNQCTSTMYSACLDLSASQKGACNGQGPRTICCWSESPSCYTMLMRATARPGKFYSIFQCQAIGGVETLFASPPGPSTTSSEPPSSSESTSVSTVSSTMIIGNGNGGQSTPSPGGSNSGGNNSSNGNSTPIGAIVGGVVGGVAAIGIIGFLFFFIIRNKRKDDVIQEPKPPVAAQSPPPPPPLMTSTDLPSPQSAYQYPPPQQVQHPGAGVEFKGYFQPQQPPQQHMQPQQPYNANNTSPYGYHAAAGPPSNTSPGAAQNQGLGVPQQQQQQYPQGVYPHPQPQPMVVMNELPAQHPLGSEGHRAELN